MCFRGFKVPMANSLQLAQQQQQATNNDTTSTGSHTRNSSLFAAGSNSSARHYTLYYQQNSIDCSSSRFPAVVLVAVVNVQYHCISEQRMTAMTFVFAANSTEANPRMQRHIHTCKSQPKRPQHSPSRTSLKLLAFSIRAQTG